MKHVITRYRLFLSTFFFTFFISGTRVNPLNLIPEIILAHLVGEWAARAECLDRICERNIPFNAKRDGFIKSTEDHLCVQ